MRHVNKGPANPGLTTIFLSFILLSGCAKLPNKEQKFEVCTSGQAERSECTELLDITIKRPLWKMGGPGGGRYYKRSPGYLAVSIHGDGRMQERVPYPYEVVVHFRGGETLEQNFALWLSTRTAGGNCIVNKPFGGLWAISQICEVDGHQLGSPAGTYYVPAKFNDLGLQTCIQNFRTGSVYDSIRLVKQGPCGAPVAWFYCAEPPGTIAKRPLTKTGCAVRAMLRPHVFIEYSIYYRHLQEWQSVHEEVMRQLNQVLTIQERRIDHGQ